jgi:hypothetical protein
MPESYFPALDCRRNRQAEKPGPETSGSADRRAARRESFGDLGQGP